MKICWFNSKLPSTLKWTKIQLKSRNFGKARIGEPSSTNWVRWQFSHTIIRNIHFASFHYLVYDHLQFHAAPVLGRVRSDQPPMIITRVPLMALVARAPKCGIAGVATFVEVNERFFLICSIMQCLDCGFSDDTREMLFQL